MATTTFCSRCGAPVAAGSAFCNRCGAAVAPQTAAPSVAAPASPPPAYALASYQQVTTALPHKAGRPLPWILAGVAIVGLMLVLAVVGYSIGQRLAQPVSCEPPACKPPPPVSPPLAASHQYVSSSLGFALEYADLSGLPADNQPKMVKNDDHSIGWTIAGFPYTVSGQTANGRSPQQLVERIQQSNYPDATLVYTIPQAGLGYTIGYGNVYSVALRSSSGKSANARLIVMAAIKNDVAVTVDGVGPFVKTTTKDGHPNPAETPLAEVIGLVTNTVTWRGDPPL